MMKMPYEDLDIPIFNESCKYKQLVQQLGECGAILAGGAAIQFLPGQGNVPFKDWDFFLHESVHDNNCKKIKDILESCGYPDEDETIGTAYNGSAVYGYGEYNQVQLIVYNAEESVLEHIQKFDITACQVAVYKNHVYFTPEAFTDNLSKTINLSVNANTFTPHQLRYRVEKYAAKGYKCPIPLFLRMIKDCVEKHGIQSIFNYNLISLWSFSNAEREKLKIMLSVLYPEYGKMIFNKSDFTASSIAPTFELVNSGGKTYNST